MPPSTASSVPATARTGAEAPALAALQLTDIYSGYGLVEVLHGITLPVVSGQITAILGPNGAGKSTLCQTIAGLVPASAGTIVHRGVDVSGQRAHQRAH